MGIIYTHLFSEEGLGLLKLKSFRMPAGCLNKGAEW